MIHQKYRKKIYEYLPWVMAGLLVTGATHAGIFLLHQARRTYMFVHIPKTGGTSLNRWIDTLQQKGLCSSIQSAHTHYISAKQAIQMGYKPITIIREPAQRFISSYYYWKHGSSDIVQWRRQPNWKKADHLNSPDDLIRVLSNSKHPDYKKTLNAIMQQDHFTHKHHFLPQSLWANVDPGKITIICYDNQHLSDHIQKVFSAMSIHCPLEKMPAINQSLIPQGAQLSLSKESIAWLHRIYEKDYLLWNTHCQAKQN